MRQEQVLVAIEYQCIVSVEGQRDSECWVPVHSRCQVSDWWRFWVPKFSNVKHTNFFIWFHESTNIRKIELFGFVKHVDDEHDKMDEPKSKKIIFLIYVQDGL